MHCSDTAAAGASNSNTESAATGASSTPLGLPSLPAATSSLSTVQSEPVKVSLWNLLDSDSSDEEEERSKKPEASVTDEKKSEKEKKKEDIGKKTDNSRETTPETSGEKPVEEQDARNADTTVETVKNDVNTSSNDTANEKTCDNKSSPADLNESEKPSGESKTKEAVVCEKYRDVSVSSSRDSCELKLVKEDREVVEGEKKESAEEKMETESEAAPETTTTESSTPTVPTQTDAPGDNTENQNTVNETESTKPTCSDASKGLSEVSPETEESNFTSDQAEKSKVVYKEIEESVEANKVDDTNEKPEKSVEPVKDLEEVLDDIQRKRDEERAKYLPKEKVQRKKWYSKFEYVPTGEKLYRSVNSIINLDKSTYTAIKSVCLQMYLCALWSVFRQQEAC